MAIKRRFYRGVGGFFSFLLKNSKKRLRFKTMCVLFAALFATKRAATPVENEQEIVLKKVQNSGCNTN